MIDFDIDLIAKIGFLEGLQCFLLVAIQGLKGVIAFIDGLQKVREFSGGFLRGFMKVS